MYSQRPYLTRVLHALIRIAYNSGRLVLFELLTARSEVFKAFELIPFVFLGVVGGVFGSLFISLNKQFEIFRRSSGLYQYPISEGD